MDGEPKVILDDTESRNGKPPVVNPEQLLNGKKPEDAGGVEVSLPDKGIGIEAMKEKGPVGRDVAKAVNLAGSLIK